MSIYFLVALFVNKKYVWVLTFKFVNNTLALVYTCILSYLIYNCLLLCGMRPENTESSTRLASVILLYTHKVILPNFEVVSGQ